ncbi:Y-family DNA polymerase [Lactobacillus sp. YT155]|uniref:Y-family DNA polymerase n=1 Tax=Lactobacillus sp. YT155 TaxID=3060955 RepID=UPI0026601311|nr:Y-family DNA polymerase [Lactobacillus sp. YT155]MDO1604505.1 Y-family DNA polymerase [Lactobacillus sp. YT155]
MYDYRHEPRRVVFMIDSKSFFASVECAVRGKNPLTTILVVMSATDNTGSGLVLAASPMAKKLFGISNVSRAKDVPIDDDRLMVVPPRMNLYIKVNLQIKDIFEKYVAPIDIHPYSIDESMLDLTSSWKLFGDNPYEVARKIQIEVRKETGIYLTVGIGDNPMLAKLALDLEAKHNHSLIAQWHYEDVPDKLWPVTDLSSVWSIGHRTAEKLQNLGMNSIYDLAHYNPYLLKQKFGKMGSQLFALSWGIDRSIIKNKYQPKDKSYGNSQVLPKTYRNKKEIEIVIKELAEQVAARLRSHHVLAGSVSLGVYNAQNHGQKSTSGFQKTMKIDPTNRNSDLKRYVIQIFEEKWQKDPIRYLNLSCGNLSPDKYEQLDLFDQDNNNHKLKILDTTVDEIRKKYGFTSVVKLASKQKGATAIKRAGLVGGHAGGNAYE